MIKSKTATPVFMSINKATTADGAFTQNMLQEDGKITGESAQV